MPIEEITLSAPHESPTSRDVERPTRRRPQPDDDGTVDVAALARSFSKAARRRDRFAFTDKGRERRRQQFEQSTKAVVKSIATEASRAVDDRSARMEVRTRIYATVMLLVKELSTDQLTVVHDARRSMRWALGIAALGLAGIIWMLIDAQVVSWPF